MATFVSLATCHHCPIRSTRRGLIYRDSLSVLSRNLRVPGGPRGPVYCSVRPDLPQSSSASQPKTPGGMRHLVVTHLRRLLMLGPAHCRRLPG